MTAETEEFRTSIILLCRRDRRSLTTGTEELQIKNWNRTRITFNIFTGCEEIYGGAKRRGHISRHDRFYFRYPELRRNIFDLYNEMFTLTILYKRILRASKWIISLHPNLSEFGFRTWEPIHEEEIRRRRRRNNDISGAAHSCPQLLMLKVLHIRCFYISTRTDLFFVSILGWIKERLNIHRTALQTPWDRDPARIKRNTGSMQPTVLCRIDCS